MVKQVILIGASPPPFGGVTVFVERLAHSLKLARAQNIGAIFKTIFRREVRLVHINVSKAFYIYILTVLLGRLANKKIVLTIHGEFLRYDKFGRKLVRNSIRISKHTVLLNKESMDAVGASLSHKVSIIETFIPPSTISVARHITKSWPQQKKTILTYAPKRYIENEKDVYGISDVYNVAKNNPRYYWILVDPSDDYPEWHGQNLLRISEPVDLFSLLKRVDVYVRNTTTDGDSLAIYEALYQGCHVLATDVVSRPSRVKTFSNVQRLPEILQTLKFDERFSYDLKEINVVEKYKQLYSSILS